MEDGGTKSLIDNEGEVNLNFKYLYLMQPSTNSQRKLLEVSF